MPTRPLTQGQRRQVHQHWKNTYGLAPQHVAMMLDEQGGRCGICGCPVVVKGGTRARGTMEAPATMHVDHCHRSGLVRGLLCGPCNRGIGGLDDNLQYVMRAYVYLLRSDSMNRIDRMTR